jgi:hypothetical protein
MDPRPSSFLCLFLSVFSLSSSFPPSPSSMVTLAKIRRKGGIVAVSESLVILSLELLNIPSTNTPPPTTTALVVGYFSP